jgi:hypothetical protein
MYEWMDPSVPSSERALMLQSTKHNPLPTHQKGVGKKVIADLEHILDYDLLPRLAELKVSCVGDNHARCIFYPIGRIGGMPAHVKINVNINTTTTHPGARTQRTPGVEARLAFQKIWGVGPKTAAALSEDGIHSIGELRVRVFLFLAGMYWLSFTPYQPWVGVSSGIV